MSATAEQNKPASKEELIAAIKEICERLDIEVVTEGFEERSNADLILLLIRLRVWEEGQG